MSRSAWDKIQIIREKDRPTVREYLPLVFDDFIELHGDRCFGDDRAIIGGIATFDGRPVTVIANVKGRNLEENQESNFAMGHPEGYRKALRLMKQAEKFHRPVITLVDTPGAYCGIEAEERGQHEALARNQMEMMRLATPILSVILGEGSSGGALGIAVCDHLSMLENATYTIISPRGFASILWKDPTREKEAANSIKITAEDLLEFGICDTIIPEPAEGAHTDTEATAAAIAATLRQALPRYNNLPMQTLLEQRYQKFRGIGDFSE